MGGCFKIVDTLGGGCKTKQLLYIGKLTKQSTTKKVSSKYHFIVKHITLDGWVCVCVCMCVCVCVFVGGGSYAGEGSKHISV